MSIGLLWASNPFVSIIRKTLSSNSHLNFTLSSHCCIVLYCIVLFEMYSRNNFIRLGNRNPGLSRVLVHILSVQIQTLFPSWHWGLKLKLRGYYWQLTVSSTKSYWKRTGLLGSCQLIRRLELFGRCLETFV